MSYDGTIKIDTSINSDGVKKGVKGISTNIKSMAGAFGVIKAATGLFDMLKSSVSSAFDRTDTMKRFNRTMTTLTGDTAAAGEALEALKGKTKDTAYGLDTAAKATQGFVTRGMEIGDATEKVGVWSDAVAFYGKGTNEQLEGVTDALGKMLTKGTVEMDQLNRLFDVGIDAVGMYAKATGQASSDVQDDLSMGKISSKDFVDVVTKAMSEGTNGVQKISGAAKDAGASWQGTFDNMKAATTRGTIGIMDAIDAGLAKINLPSMREMVAGFGAGIETTLGNISTKISDVIQVIGPPIVDVMNTFKQAFKNSIPAIKEVVSAVTDFVKDVAASMQSGGIKSAISTFGNMFSNLASVVGSISKTVLPVLAKAIDLTAKSLKVAVPLVVGYKTAIKAWSVVSSVTSKMKALSTALAVASKEKSTLVIVTKAMGTAQIAEAAKTGASTVAISLKQAAVGVLTGKIGLATVAQALWNTAMSMNPIGLVIGAVAGLAAGIGLLTLATNDSATSTKNLTASFEKVGGGITSFKDGMANAKSHLSDFNDALFISAEGQQKLQDEMAAVQNGITNICYTATGERKKLVEEDIVKLDEYFVKLNELNKRELAVQQEKSGAIAQQAVTIAQTHQGSLAEYQAVAQEHIATAKAQATVEQELIQSQTTQEIALLNQKYGEKANMQNNAYAVEYGCIMLYNQEQLDATNKGVADVTTAFTNGYNERMNASEGFKVANEKYNADAVAEDQLHAENIKNIGLSYVANSEEQHNAIAREDARHEKERKKMWADMTKGMTDEQIEQLGVLMGMAAQTELYGGQMDGKTTETVNGILSAYDSMPAKTREAMKNAMSPLLDEMENAEPGLFNKAKAIGKGIIGTLKKAFEEKSPSKATRRIAKYLWQGFTIQTDKDEPNLLKQSTNMAKGILSAFDMGKGVNLPMNVDMSTIDVASINREMKRNVMAQQSLLTASVTRRMLGKLALAGGGTRNETIETHNNNTVQTVRIVADKSKIYDVVMDEGKRRGVTI